MAIFLEQLYAETKKLYHLELLAGSSGLSHIVNWVYITEDIVASEFLSGNELVITTGISVSENPDWLKEFISVLIHCHACGLIVNTGKYILPDDITDDILTLCNQHHFPLFIMPWKTRLIHITKDYYHRIFEDTRSYENTCALFHKALQGYELSSLELSSLKEEHYLTEHYAVYCMDIKPMNEKINFSFKEHFSIFYPFLLHQLTTFAKEFSYFKNYHISLFEDKIVILFSNADAQSLTVLLSDLTSHTKLAFPNYQIYAGFSETVSDIMQLRLAYLQAGAALLLSQNSHKNYSFYKDLGFMKILLDVKHPEILSDYVNEHLSPLIDYDEKHHANLLETLNRYLQYNGSLQQIAENMFCHRNTVHYRIGLIKKILSVSLSEPEQNFELSTALFIHDFLKIYHSFIFKN